MYRDPWRFSEIEGSGVGGVDAFWILPRHDFYGGTGEYMLF